MPKTRVTINLNNIEWDTTTDDNEPTPSNLPQAFEHQATVTTTELRQPADQLLEGLIAQAINEASDHHHYLICDCVSSVRFH